jgi:hypothetical protein
MNFNRSKNTEKVQMQYIVDIRMRYTGMTMEEKIKEAHVSPSSNVLAWHPCNFF